MSWTHFKQATCLPYNCGCELIRLEEWIRQPINFWSSIIYLIIGLYLYQVAQTFHERFWSLLCVILGLSSHLAHGSFTQLAMSADFASIITLMVFPVLMHKEEMRRKWISTLSVIFTYILVFCIMFFLGKILKILLSLMIFSVVLFYHFRFLKSFLNRPYFKKSLVLLLSGFIFFVLDENKIFCSPESFFQLHSLWHLLTAFSLYCYGRWIFNSRRW